MTSKMQFTSIPKNPLFHRGAAFRPIQQTTHAALRLARWLTGSLLCMVAMSSFAGGLKVGDAFPDFSGFKIEGKLPEMKNKVVLVDFWASWCAPCKAAFRAMDELQKTHGAQGLVIVAVNVDANRQDMEAFLKKKHVTFSVVRDAGQKLVEKVQASSMPTSYLLDRAGRIRFVHVGFHGDDTRKKYTQEIEALLKQ